MVFHYHLKKKYNSAMDGFRTLLAVWIGRCAAFCIKAFNLGAGATWPGEVALMVHMYILTQLFEKLDHIIIVAGTNGKTTTSSMIRNILQEDGFQVVHNQSGANLENGIVSALVLDNQIKGKTKMVGVFEVDENTVPIILERLSQINIPTTIVLLNLFRDQLDRYGEVDVIARRWKKSLDAASSHAKLILNADDPQIAYLGTEFKGTVFYFGKTDKKYVSKNEHATDSTTCLVCGNSLSYEGIYYSHIGAWHCPHCGLTRPSIDLTEWKSPLPGVYNQYNTLAAVLTAQTCGVTDEVIKKSISGFSPAFGRQEEIEIQGKKVKLFLSKNPVGFNESLKTILDLGAKTIVLILNDRIPDGRDVSWIWDVDFEIIPEDVSILVCGDRVYDMALRIKYSNDKSIPRKNLFIEPTVEKVIQKGLDGLDTRQTLYILPTYSAMLEVRKILTGKKIL